VQKKNAEDNVVFFSFHPVSLPFALSSNFFSISLISLFISFISCCIPLLVSGLPFSFFPLSKFLDYKRLLFRIKSTKKFRIINSKNRKLSDEDKGVDNTPFEDKEEVVNILKEFREDSKVFIPKRILDASKQEERQRESDEQRYKKFLKPEKD